MVYLPIKYIFILSKILKFVASTFAIYRSIDSNQQIKTPNCHYTCPYIPPPSSPIYTLLSPPFVLATDDDDDEIVCRCWCTGDALREYDDSTG